MLLQIRVALLQITTMCYYELRQLYQIITNYGNTLLQITPLLQITSQQGDVFFLT